jgi:nickel/cobalt transporter (NicO) family protein
MNPIIENPFTWMYFPTALMLGALHALEPGHAKTLTAAYLIGIKGTKKDALFLGLSVALTHSIVVIGISVAALWIGRETFTQDVTHWLQIGSGVLVVLLGAWLLVKRLIQMRKDAQHHRHGAPEPIHISNELSSGVLEIINTPNGERMRFLCDKSDTNLNLRVIINRPDGLEILKLKRLSQNEFLSEVAPNEPHEFSAEFEISIDSKSEVVPFEMHEPHGHHHDEHDHSLMSNDDHARAHAATIPEYAKKGERPTTWQIITFGAAGGMIPCPASITVMLLALSIGKFGAGLFAVAGFSIGLAVTLVGIGLIVVAGLSKMQGSGRFHWVSSKAPIISAAVVMLSGFAALIFAH